MTASTLVVTALPEEARPLRRTLGRTPDVVVAVTGDGAARAGRATRELLAALHPRLLVIAGLAGALSPDARPGDVRLVREVQDAAGAVRRPSATLLERARRVGPPDDVLVSMPQLACTPEERIRIRDAASIAAPDAGLVDLESAACAAEADAAGVPWLVVRAVSDGPDDLLPRWLEEARDEDGSLSRPAVVAGGLLHPTRIPALIVLALRARRAGRALARSVPAILTAVSATAESEQPLPGGRA